MLLAFAFSARCFCFHDRIDAIAIRKDGLMRGHFLT